MFDEVNTIEKYVNDKKELQRLILQIVDNEDSDDDVYLENLKDFLNKDQYKENKAEIKHFLHLILIISNNHHRHPNFFNKFEKILTISSNFYQPFFSNHELFIIFRQSKPILFLLLKTKIMTIDQKIFKSLQSFVETKENEINYYFYPELNAAIKTGTIEGIDKEKYKIKLNEDNENFETNRQQFENDSTLSKIIREDLIDDFIIYVQELNISLSSQIKPSLFETNSMFIEKEPTLIEYSFFFGSIRIIKYLEINQVELSSSLWLYAVHSNNPEVISFLEEKNIKIDDKTFSEAIKCHHNDIANYIFDNYFDSSTTIKDLNDEDVLNIYSSSNYEFFPYEIDENKSFFSLVKNDYTELINFYFELNKEKIENYIKMKSNSDFTEIFEQVLDENKLDIVYDLLLKMTSIPQNYFRSYKNITKIALPPSIESICNDSFSLCTSMIEISIPSSVKSIGDYAFFGCSSLLQITIPSSVKSIGSNVFRECSSMTQITILSDEISMGDYVFNECPSLMQITIPSNLISIGKSLFFRCPKINHFTILQCNKETIDFINNSILVYKSNPNIDENYDTLLLGKPTLEYVDVPSFIKRIDNYAFHNRTTLKKVTFSNPSSLESIGDSSFEDCTLLCDILIPESVSSIGPNAFFNCSSLIEISLPDILSEISYCCFSGCSSITQIIIPGSVTVIGKNAFDGCSALVEVEFNYESSLELIDDNAFRDCSTLIEISIPSSVTEIGMWAFEECSSLIEISIPFSVGFIGMYAFSGCTSLEKISLPYSVYRENLGIPSNVCKKFD